MSLIAATQFTAVATAVLALFAFVTAVFAFLAFRKQSKEVGLLQQQATREAGERRKAQAVQVFVAVGGLTPDMTDEVRLVNSSGQPIYDLAASWADGAELQRVPHLMPGDVYPFFTAAPADAAAPPVVWLDFRDAAGLRWRTTSQGQLTGPQGLEPPARPRWWQIRRRWTARRASQVTQETPRQP
jgi:hypothetical protein